MFQTYIIFCQHTCDTCILVMITYSASLDFEKTYNDTSSECSCSQMIASYRKWQLLNSTASDICFCYWARWIAITSLIKMNLALSNFLNVKKNNQHFYPLFAKWLHITWNRFKKYIFSLDLFWHLQKSLPYLLSIFFILFHFKVTYKWYAFLFLIHQSLTISIVPLSSLSCSSSISRYSPTSWVNTTCTSLSLRPHSKHHNCLSLLHMYIAWSVSCKHQVEESCAKNPTWKARIKMCIIYNNLVVILYVILRISSTSNKWTTTLK